MAQTQDTSTTTTAGTPRGVLKAGGTGVGRTNEYAVESTIAEGILAHYLLKARLAPTYNRGFQKDFGNAVQDNGDTLTLRRSQTYGIQTGLAAWQPQKQLQELVHLRVSNIKGIQTYREWNDAGLFGNEDYEADQEMARNESITYGIESDCAQGYDEGFVTGITPVNRTLDSNGNVTGMNLAAAGKDSEPGGNYPDNLVLAFMQAELNERGLGGRQFNAVLDSYTSTSMGRTALFTQQYGVGGAGAAAQSSGSLDGQMVAGWKIADATLNGRQEFGNSEPTDVTFTVRTQPDDGATSVVVNLTTGWVIKKGTRISFAGRAGINRRTLQPLGTLAQFIVTADATGASNQATLNFFPALRQADDLPAAGTNEITDAYRRRNIQELPEAGDAIYINEPGILPQGSTSVVNNPNGVAASNGGRFRAAIHNATTTRSFLVAQDAGVLIYSMPRMDPRQNMPYVKATLEGVKLEVCIAIDSELAPQGSSAQGARPGMLTLYQAWTRIGVGVPEWEAGALVTGRSVV